jgi:hypothetical protein
VFPFGTIVKVLRILGARPSNQLRGHIL